MSEWIEVTYKGGEKVWLNIAMFYRISVNGGGATIWRDNEMHTVEETPAQIIQKIKKARE